jgi:hypothetical protein
MTRLPKVAAQDFTAESVGGWSFKSRLKYFKIE